MPHSFGPMTAAATIAIALFMTLALAIPHAHADLERLDGAGIAAALSGKTIAGKRGGKIWMQTFDATGGTAYSVAGEAATQGSWRVQEDRLCSQSPAAPAWVCYDIFRDGDLIVLIGENGEKWPALIADDN